MGFSPVHVGETELTRPLEPVLEPARYGSARLLVRLHGAPLGFATVPLDGGRAPAERVHDAVDAQLGEAVRAHLEADGLPAGALGTGGLEAVEDPRCTRPGPYGDPEEPVTVVVCTRNPRPGLRQTLDSLLALDPAPAEIILVDNGSSTDAAKRVAGELGDPRLRLVQEPIAGVSRARNRGLAEARTDLVAFTDDDVRADPGWIGALRRGFTRAPHVACVCGLVPAAELETPAQVVFDARVSWSRRFLPRLFDLGEHRPGDRFFPFSPGFGTGNNLALRRSAGDGSGRFDEALGPGTPAESFEDGDLFLRVILAGWTLAYEPAAIVWHLHRRDPVAFRHQMRTYGVGLGAYAFKHAREPGFARLVPAALVRLERDGRRAQLDADEGLGLTRAQLRGVAAGPVAYLRARRRLRGRPPVTPGPR